MQCRRQRFNPWVRNIPWSRKWQPTPVFLPGKSHGQRSLVGYSSWGHKTVRHILATKHTHPIPYHLFAKQHHRHSDSSQLGKSAPKLTVLTLKRTFVFARVPHWFRRWHSVSLEMNNFSKTSRLFFFFFWMPVISTWEDKIGLNRALTEDWRRPKNLLLSSACLKH